MLLFKKQIVESVVGKRLDLSFSRENVYETRMFPTGKNTWCYIQGIRQGLFS